MGGTEIGMYVLAGVGAILAGFSLARLFPIHINGPAANAMLMKLLAANNHYRARKLCAAMPGSYLDAVRAAIAAAEESKSRDLSALEATVRPAFDAKAEGLVARWRSLVERGLMGVLLVLGAVALGATSDVFLWPVLIAAIAAIAVGVWLLFVRASVEVACDVARVEILPKIVKSVIDATPEPVKSDESGPFRTADLKAHIVHRRPSASASLRDGVCPTCGHKTITRIDGKDDPRFHKLVCMGCGYAQEFADLTQITN